MEPLRDPGLTQLNLGMFQPQVDSGDLRIAEDCQELRKRVLSQEEASDIPNGFAWNMDLLPTGELAAGLLYNLDELDERTVVGWAEDYLRILTDVVTDPDREWKPA
jgi:hypothetical protein